MNDDFDSIPDDLSDLDGMFPSAPKPQPKASPSAHATRRPASLGNQLNWTEVRPIARYRDEAVVLLLYRVICETCQGWDSYVEGIFLRRVHLHHSPVTELARVLPGIALPDLPREIRREDKSQPICSVCAHRQGFHL